MLCFYYSTKFAQTFSGAYIFDLVYIKDFSGIILYATKDFNAIIHICM